MVKLDGADAKLINWLGPIRLAPSGLQASTITRRCAGIRMVGTRRWSHEVYSFWQRCVSRVGGEGWTRNTLKTPLPN